MQNYNNNGNKLLDKITDLDPKLITDADKKPRIKSRLLIGITSGMATVAAAAMIAVAANNLPAKVPPIVDSDPSVSNLSSSDPVDSSSSNSVQEPPVTSDPTSDTANDPPKLDFSKYKDLKKLSLESHGVGAMGGYEVSGGSKTEYLSFAELELASPWNGAVIETMPVYMSGSTEIPDLDRMYARVKEVAAALGIPEDDLKISDNYVDMTESIKQNIKIAEEAGATEEEIEEMVNRMVRGTMSMVSVEAKTDNVRISLDNAYRTYILFEENLELPEGYNYSKDATDEEKGLALRYLTDKYKELIGYSAPMPGRAGDRGCYVYEADGDLAQQIVNYWINATSFDLNITEKGVIDIYSDGALEKIDDYPILTAAQAEQILKSNRYAADKRMPSDANILKVDMVYRNPAGAMAVMPYYEFYVESDKEPYFDCDVVCDVYTIAAVPEEFIDMDTADYGVRA